MVNPPKGCMLAFRIEVKPPKINFVSSLGLMITAIILGDLLIAIKYQKILNTVLRRDTAVYI